MGEVKKPYPQNQEDIMYITVLVFAILEKNYIIEVIQLCTQDMLKMGQTETTEMMEKMDHRVLQLLLRGLMILLPYIMEHTIELVLLKVEVRFM